MKNRVIICALFLAGMICEVAPLFAEPPVLQCPLVTEPPRLDGKLDDAVWKDIPIVYGLRSVDGKKRARPLTRFRVCTDGRMLYLAMQMMDPQASKLSRKNLGRDKLDFSEDVEIFLAPFVNQPHYYHFAVDPAGSDWDNMSMGVAMDNNYGWKHKEVIGEKGWVSEVAIPLTELGRPGGVKRGDQLSFNLCRIFRGGKLQAWSPTGNSFHNRAAFGTLIIGNFRDATSQPIDALQKKLQRLKSQSNENPSLKAQIPALTARMKEIRALSNCLTDSSSWGVFQKKYKTLNAQMDRGALSGLGLRIVNPWNLPFSEDLPDVKSQDVTMLNLTVFQDEYITRAIAVANGTDSGVAFRAVPADILSVDGLKKISFTKHIKLSEAQEIALRGGGRQRDPLPEIGLESVVKLAPGENSIIWITLNTYGMKPGSWVGAITFKPTIKRELEKTINLKITVLAAKFPQGPKPWSCTWTRDFGGTALERYPDLCIQDQKEHFTNVHTVGWGDVGINRLKYDAQGHIIEKFDFSGLDKWIAWFGSKDQIFLLDARYEFFPKSLGGKGKIDGIGRENFSKWAKALRKHFESKGVSINNFAWYAADEPVSPAHAEHVATFGKLLRAVDPDQKIFVTVFNKVTSEALEIMAPYVTIWSPALYCSEEHLAFIKKQQHARHFSYAVLNRTARPYGSYRMSSWKAYYRGFEGVGFWSYNSSGKTSVWDDFDWMSHDFSVIYEGTDKPVSSVRWEAWRQGIQDYRLLDWVKELAKSCPDKALSTNATKLVKKAVHGVLTDVRPMVADEWGDQLRTIAIKMLQASGQISVTKETEAVPLCLTGNSGTQFVNSDTGGFYRYDPAISLKERYDERCGVGQGPIYFKGKNAKSGKQQGNKADGDLTDGLRAYPQDWCLYTSSADPSNVTFDLKRNYLLNHAVLYWRAAKHTLKIYVRETDESKPWTLITTISPKRPARRTFDNGCYIDLKKTKARYVRLEIHGRDIRLGEFKIFGYPSCR